jgi:signal transduction histidine kinase
MRLARSERERLISDLEAKNEEMERFTYTVSHDLKSPLVTIQNFLGLIQKDLNNGKYERAQRDLSRVGGASQKMFQLLDDLLALSRAGRLIGKPEAIHLTPLVEDVVELLSGPIAEAGVEVRVADDLPVVYGDVLRLSTLFQNLIENAIKFSRDSDHPRIDIAWHASSQDCSPIFFVSDNGCGIAVHDQQQIFDLFNKLDSDSTGSGVGLALAQRIVAVHQGRIWVESQGLGQGSTFYFTLHLRPDS